MNRAFLISILTVVCFLIAATDGFASEQKLPVIDGKPTVATVNGEPITLEELSRAITSSHSTISGLQEAGHVNFSHIMERLITRRLILIEAGNMGIDQLPAITSAVKQYSKDTLIELLMDQHVKDIKADEEEVEKLYEKMVREWKIKPLKFKKEADAKKIEAEIKADNDFDAIAKKAVAEGIAEGGEEEYLKDKDLILPIAQIVSKMQVGSTSPVISFGKKGFIIFKLEGSRLPEKEDPQAKKQAKRQVLNQKKLRAARDYYEDLRERYVKVDQKLLDSLDYESKEPGFEKLLQDERIVVEVTGDDPITVGKLSNALKQKHYHGVERAIKSKSINKKKNAILESMIEKQILLREALNQGIDRTEAYKNRVKEYEKSMVSGAFIEKVVAPEIKLSIEELKTYYKENSQEYTSPEMMRIKSLVFADRGDAGEALAKLMQGTDFNWLSSHADGQVDKNTQGLLAFEGKMLILSSMPEGVQEIVSGANPGDFRLYASPDGHFYVLYIYHVVAPKQRPFGDVKKEIAKEIYNDKLKKAIGVWAGKLKEYYPVEIYKKDLRK